MINWHPLPLCSIPNGTLHFMSCACIRPLFEPHSMPNSYMRLPSSSSLASGYLLIFFLSVWLHQVHAQTAESTQYFFYITVHALASGTCPNCTLYPVVATSLPEIFKLLTTFLFYCKIRKYLFIYFMKNHYSKLELGN